MYAPNDRHDPHGDADAPHGFLDDPLAHVGDDIAVDRRGRIIRRFVYSGLALAAAGLITLLNGCDKAEAPGPPEDAEIINEVGGTSNLPDGMPSFKPLPEALEDFALFPADGPITFNPTDEGVVLDGRGYFASTEEYGLDFTVTYEYRFPNAAEMDEADRPNCNTGCLLFIDETDKVWPRCLEVQGKWTETANVKSNARDVTVNATTDEAARDAARKPPGEWNRVEVVSSGGALTVMLNGTEVTTSEPTDLTRGRIGFQAEGFPVEFRGVTIEELGS
ncbi:3-keto-disaccharide hydrolase [Alienimonas chondri]|uniref:3-keto-alpha-glucoside-1,2-lyase/3-keto-2-hydroxy-glucal hydratase domain-containing protein n=1 Tax=Alienimonas chondri TaxID=2681879 RepID=A0ABX1VAD0_9PLAN|nr:DUF1080 domain-containing protein [Alienimonas chondri]NNJ24708.1 hypothetical protein [Alienimonas chondri]